MRISSLLLIVLTITIASIFISGIRLFAVVSSSMEPFLPVGSLVVTSGIKPPGMVGDVIAFHKPQLGTIVHRVTSIETSNERVVIHTKGDANTSGDAWTVSPGDVYGKVTLVIPYVGYAAIIANSAPAVMVIAIIVLAASIVWTSNRGTVKV